MFDSVTYMDVETVCSMGMEGIEGNVVSKIKSAPLQVD